jgi:hypothetical protein
MQDTAARALLFQLQEDPSRATLKRSQRVAQKLRVESLSHSNNWRREKSVIVVTAIKRRGSNIY